MFSRQSHYTQPSVLDMDYFCVEWKKYLFAEFFFFVLYSVQTEEMGAFS